MNENEYLISHQLAIVLYGICSISLIILIFLLSERTGSSHNHQVKKNLDLIKQPASSRKLDKVQTKLKLEKNILNDSNIDNLPAEKILFTQEF